jgi:hypothetical protein
MKNKSEGNENGKEKNKFIFIFKGFISLKKNI